MILLSTADVAKRLGLSVGYLRLWLYRHQEFIPTERYGIYYVWTDEAVKRIEIARQQKAADLAITNQQLVN